MDENTPFSAEDFTTSGDSYDTTSTGGPARRAVLAGLGAVAYAFDVAGDAYERFVERGQRVQQDVEGRVDEVRGRNAGARGRVEEYYRTAVDACLDRANLPSKADLETLNVKLNVVSRKIDDLQMQRVQEAVPPASSPADTATDDAT